MANITIDTLYQTGYDLFHDSESFIDQLESQEHQVITGGYYSNFYGFNSFSGGGFSGSYGSYNAFSGGYSGYGGYYNKSWC
ncbi:hypothetical protein [Nostoc sp. TCL26-01]|uniref:hypothetical protein n=1 Tax=Nostoc sp. TCL26-01 TaxID=2576904 RepID=UPI0015BCCE2D|nr:hypothetical protein [Nostoc sp. TCL26-01]QLE56040.1 hypothetical protein FD725_11195 [Nostoc sp. TCL26-01]